MNYLRTLLWVNRKRIAAGEWPIAWLPKGVPRHAHSCPIALALKDTGVTEVYRRSLVTAAGTERLPDFVTAWIIYFDTIQTR